MQLVDKDDRQYLKGRDCHIFTNTTRAYKHTHYLAQQQGTYGGMFGLEQLDWPLTQWPHWLDSSRDPWHQKSAEPQRHLLGGKIETNVSSTSMHSMKAGSLVKAGVETWTGKEGELEPNSLIALTVMMYSVSPSKPSINLSSMPAELRSTMDKNWRKEDCPFSTGW